MARIPRIVIAGASSGVGKTSITCGIIHGFGSMGYTVQPFKVGPDYIDPSHLSRVAGRETYNLDAWLMSNDTVRKTFAQRSTADISVIEGVMGFYDGFSGGSDRCSTHHVSGIIGAPVVLVVDASRAARSVAAVAAGFVKFHKKSGIAGIILNRLAGARHESMCRAAMRSAGICVLGAVPRDESLSMPSRHLGLVPAREKNAAGDSRRIARAISEYIDMKKLLRICQGAGTIAALRPARKKKPTARIAVALDSSFNFYYRGNLDALESAGCSLEFFSPVNSASIPPCDGIYIGGGFPEVAGARLERNASVRRQLKKLGGDDIPIYAECGGLMYLGRSIEQGGRRFRMTGLLDTETRMTSKMTLGYTRGRFSHGCLVSGRGAILHGHEFHYSAIESVPRDSRFAYRLGIGRGITDGQDGLLVNNALASYGHLYLAPRHAARIASACVKYSRK